MSRTIRDVSWLVKNYDLCSYRDDRINKFYLNGSLPHWQRNFSHRRLRREWTRELNRFRTKINHEILLSPKAFDRTNYW